MSELTDRELNAQIAEKVMGWAPYPTIHHDWGWQPKDAAIVWSLQFMPSTDRNAAAQVLERIGEMGLDLKLVANLFTPATQGPYSKLALQGYISAALHATPRQICLAALKAVEERTALEGGRDGS